jgi:YHS domain-containing protein
VTKEFGGQTFHFCSDHCLHAFEVDPQRYVGSDGRPIEQRVAEHARHGDHAAHATDR